MDRNNAIFEKVQEINESFNYKYNRVQGTDSTESKLAYIYFLSKIDQKENGFYHCQKQGGDRTNPDECYCSFKESRACKCRVRPSVKSSALNDKINFSQCHRKT